MPDLREIFFKEYLKTRRIGNPVRAALTPKALEILSHVKRISRRTYRDIFYVVLNIYQHHPGFFPVVKRKVTRSDIFFRMSRKDAETVMAWAWKRNQRRRNFIGDLMERFFELVPIAVILDVFRNQKDRIFKLEEDLKSHGIKPHPNKHSETLPDLPSDHDRGEVFNLQRGHDAPHHPASVAVR